MTFFQRQLEIYMRTYLFVENNSNPYSKNPQIYNPIN